MQSTYSIGRVLLLTYLILMAPSCTNLFSNSLKDLIYNNRFAQHLILLLLIITLFLMFGSPGGTEISKNETLNGIIIGLIIYIFFILSTKLNYVYNIAIIIILTLYFLFESQKITDYKNIMNDPILNDEKKVKLFEQFNTLQIYMLISIFGITMIGTVLYFFEKQEKFNQVGGGTNKFDYLKFFFN
jgi:hypothetical protein